VNFGLFSFKSFAHVAFGAAAAVMLVLGWVLYDANFQAIESAKSVGHSQEIINAIYEIDEQRARTEAAQRGYLLTGALPYLEELDEALKVERMARVAIKDLTADNPEQQRRILRLDTLIERRIVSMHENQALFPMAGLERIREADELGRAAIKEIYDLADVVENREIELLALRRVDEEHRHENTLTILKAVIMISLVVLIPGYIGFLGQSRARNRAERKLADMADSLPGAAYRVRSDANGVKRDRFEFVSPSVEQLFGVTRESMLQDIDQFWRCILEEDRPIFKAAIENRAQIGKPLQYDFRITHPSGETRWIRSSSSMSKEADGSFVWNGYWADVSSQRRLESALQEAKEAAEAGNRAKSVFLATMSHEIRTPMNGVLGMLELLSTTTLNAEQRTTLDIVRESGRALQRIIDDILDFSKIEAGKLEIRPTAVSIASTVEAISRLFSGNASSKCLDLRCSIDSQISPALLVDPTRLRQILNNFVSNALKFTAKGHIEINVVLVDRAEGEDRLRFTVADTGIGISPEDQARLFQPFVQATDETAARFGGTGLGLTICERLAKMMGGTIEMVSQVGVGTTMTLELSLPIADPKELRADDRVSAPNFLLTTRMRRRAPDTARAVSEGTLALLADDHPTNRSLIVRQINLLGYAAESAVNGAEALEMWKSGRFGILITDCNMPEMNGYALTRRIRELEAANGNKRIPIIACTANALGGEAEICFAAGMDDYISKPVELSVLAKKLDQWLPLARPAPPIDRSVLSSLTSGDIAAEREILTDFRRANEDDSAMLKRAVDRSNISEVTTAVHRIKGASKMVGAVGLAGVCEQLERASRADDWQGVRSNLGAFEHELERLNHFCEAEPWAIAS
jgi:PAS domain S-box-containing protein